MVRFHLIDSSLNDKSNSITINHIIELSIDLIICSMLENISKVMYSINVKTMNDAMNNSIVP